MCHDHSCSGVSVVRVLVMGHGAFNCAEMSNGCISVDVGRSGAVHNLDVGGLSLVDGGLGRGSVGVREALPL